MFVVWMHSGGCGNVCNDVGSVMWFVHACRMRRLMVWRKESNVKVREEGKDGTVYQCDVKSRGRKCIVKEFMNEMRKENEKSKGKVWKG